MLRQVERRQDAGALRLGQRSDFLARIAEDDHPRHPVRVLVGVVRDDADDDVGGVAPVRTIDGNQARPFEIVLDEEPGRQVGLRLARRREHSHQLVGVRQAALPHPYDLLRVLGDRPDRLGGRLVELQRHPVTGRQRHANHGIVQAAGLVGNPRPQHHLLQTQALRLASQATRDRFEFLDLQLERRADVEQHPIPLQALAGRPPQLHAAYRRQRFHQHAVQLRDLHQAPMPIPYRRDVAHLCNGEQPLVLGVVARGSVEQVHVLDRRQAVDEEVAQPPQLQPLGHHWMHAAIELLLAETAGARSEGVALRVP